MADASSADVMFIMPPKDVVDVLSASTAANNATQAAFNSLMRTPFLQEIYAGGLSTSGAAGAQAILPVITEGLTNFSASQLTDVSIARKLSGYASTVPLVAKSVPRGKLAEVLTGMVSNYVKFANDKSVASKKFYSSFSENLGAISSTIDSMDSDMDVLRADISALKELDSNGGSSFGDSGVLTRIRARLGKYLQVQGNSEESFMSTLALLFSITIEEVKAAVSGQEKMQDVSKIVAILESFQARLRNVRLLMTSLLDNLTKVMKKSIALMGAWYEILQNLSQLSFTSAPLEKFSDSQVALIKSAWDLLKQDAEKFTTAVSNVTSSAVGSVLEVNREVVSRSLAFAAKASRSIAIPRSVATNSKQEEAMSKITTDKSTQAALDAMTESSGKIVASFNKLLKVPFLDSLKVSAAAATGTNADGTAGSASAESTDIDLETLALNYLKRYQKLQADTVPVARNLYGYAMLQQQLIPMLGSSLTVDNYVKANLSIIAKRKEEAETVHALHNKFQQDWNTAILLVERAIAEQEEAIKGMEATIKDLVKQHRNMTIGAVLMSVGAVLFTAAAIASGGLLAVACGALGVGLVVGAGVFINNAVKLQNAINGYRSALKSAKETLSQLKVVLPLMIEIRDLVSSVTLVWNDIANKLAELHTGTEAWEALAWVLQGDDWDPFKETALTNWKSVASSVLAYVAIVSDVNPEVK